jgi:hypothetical protein
MRAIVVDCYDIRSEVGKVLGALRPDSIGGAGDEDPLFIELGRRHTVTVQLTNKKIA